MQVKTKTLAALASTVFAGALGLWLQGNHVNRDVESAAQLQKFISDAGHKTANAHLQGTVTYSDPESKLLVIQDETGGVRVDQQRASAWPDPGTELSVEGTIAPGSITPAVLAEEIRRTGLRRLPNAMPLSFENARSGLFEYKRVAMEGVLRSLYIDDHTGLLCLEVSDGTGTIAVRVKAFENREFRQLVDEKVRVRGVLSSSLDVYGHPWKSNLWVPDLSDISVLERARPIADLPPTSIEHLAQSSNLPLHRVRIHGQLTGLSRGEAVLSDGTGSVAISPVAMSHQDGESVTVVGFVRKTSDSLALTDAILMDRSTYDSAPVTGPERMPVLTTAKAIHELSGSAAAYGYPLKISAVVTYVHHASQLLFVQDRTSGIFVSAQGVKIPELKAGSRVEITGISAAGGFAPVVMKPVVRVVGQSQFPDPVKGDQEQLFSGTFDCQWVELPGVITSAHADSRQTTLTLSLGQHTFHAYVEGRHPDLASLIDSRVRLRGVLGSVFNGKRQIVGIQLFVPGWDQVKVEEPAPEDPFLRPLKPLAAVLQFSLHDDPDHQAHVRGRVLLSNPQGPTWISDETGALKIGDHGAISLAPGDQVDAIGFEYKGAFTPVLKSATIHKISSGPVPAPVKTVPDDAMDGTYDNELVQVEAKLLDANTVANQAVLLLQAGRTTFYSYVPVHGKTPDWETGSILRITGICAVDVDDSGANTPRVFRIFASSPSNVQVVQKAPVLSRSFALRVLTLMGGAILLFAGWIALLQKRVRDQTHTIAQKLKQEASLKREAQRASEAKGQFLANMSHEIRTPLNGIIGFTELTLGSALSPDQEENLTTVRTSALSLLRIVNDILDFSKVEAGKMELVPAPFSIRSFTDSVIKSVQPQAAENGIELRLQIDPGVPDMLDSDETRLRQIVLNLLSNAIKFTRQGRISLAVRMLALQGERARLEFEVADTGIGISADAQQRIFEEFQQADNSITRNYGGTGLGLAICKRLVPLFAGEMALESEPGVGTKVRFTAELKIAPQKALSTRSTAMDGDTVSLHVLVAEDNVINRRLIQRVLQQHAHTVSLAANGVEAVEFFKTERVDVILMDVHMPEMDGLQATRIIRALPGGLDLPILAFTASALDKELQLYMEAGMSGYITKPFQISELLAKLAECTSLAANDQPATVA